MLKGIPLLLVATVISSCAINTKNSPALPNKEAVLQEQNSQEIFALKDAWKLPTYFFLVDRFYDGTKTNNSNVKKGDFLSYQGGDFSGVLKKTEYLNKFYLGAFLNTPLSMNRSTPEGNHWGAHGYWIEDHLKMDEHWGTKEDLQKFVEWRKKNNQKYIVDLVLNHVSATHPWVKEHSDWFHHYGPMNNDQNDKERVEGEIFGLPDLDQDKPEVFEKLVQYGKFWIDETGADGIRLDAVRHIDHSFWKRYLPEMKKYAYEKYGKKEFLLLGEILHGDPQIYLPYVNDGFNAFFDYPLYYSVTEVFAKRQSMLKLPARLQHMDKLFGDKILWATFLENHDTPRFLSINPKSDFEDVKQAWAFLVSVRGMPLLYSGLEERIKGKNGEEGRKLLTFSRQKDKDDLAVLNKLRTDLPSLSLGVREDIRATDTHYVFRKMTEKEETLVIINRAQEPGTLVLNLEDDSLFSKEKKIADKLNRFRIFDIKDKKLILFLRKRDVIVLSLKGDVARYNNFLNKKELLKPVKVFVEADLKEGEELFMVGASERLGAWNPQKAVGPFGAVLMNKYGLELELSQGKVAEYKFIKRDAQGKVTWEDGDNHYVLVNEDLQQIRRTWNQH